MQSNKIINNINIIMPRPRLLISSSSFLGITTLRTMTRVCPQLPNIPLIKTSINHQMVNKSHFHDNNALTNVLSKVQSAIQNKNENDNTLDVKKPLKLKTFSNKEFETSLTENSQLNDFSEEQFIEELKKRELIKEDFGKTTVEIKLSDNTEHLLGKAKNGIKLSPLGQAYYNNIKSKDNDNNSSKLLNPSLKQEKFNFIITIPPQNDEDLFIETGKQKHMLIAIDENNNYYALGYLTSKNTGYVLCSQQIKTFQDQQENSSSITNNKIQFLLKFDKFQKIEKENIQRVKWDQEYISNLEEVYKKLLNTICEDLTQEKVNIYDTKGVTKDDCLKMCIEHDKIAKKKDAKHPLTEDQKKKNDINKYAQKNSKKEKNCDDVKED